MATSSSMPAGWASLNDELLMLILAPLREELDKAGTEGPCSNDNSASCKACRKACGAFRAVCKHWQRVHDESCSKLVLKPGRQLPSGPRVGGSASPT
jgi:hypothetical protein